MKNYKEIYMLGFEAGYDLAKSNPEMAMEIIGKPVKQRRNYRRKRTPRLDWTPEEDLILVEGIEAGTSIAKIALDLPNRKIPAIWARKAKLKLKTKQAQKSGLANLGQKLEGE